MLFLVTSMLESSMFQCVRLLCFIVFHLSSECVALSLKFGRVHSGRFCSCVCVCVCVPVLPLQFSRRVA